MSGMAISGILEGLPELQQRVDLLVTAGVSNLNIQAALLPGAELIADRWRSKVPSPGPGHPYSTGEYQEGIEIGPSEWDQTAFIGLDIFTEVVNPEDDFNYPEALEFGTSTMAAMPSAQPAFDESVDEVVTMTAAALDVLIAQVTVL